MRTFKENIIHKKKTGSLKEYLHKYAESKMYVNKEMEKYIKENVSKTNISNILENENLIDEIISFCRKFIAIEEKKKKIDSKTTETETQTDLNLGNFNTNFIKIKEVETIQQDLISELEFYKKEKKLIHTQNELLESNLIKLTDSNKRLADEIKILKKELNEKNEYISNLEESIRLNNDERYNTEDEEEPPNAFDTNILHKLIDKNKFHNVTKYLEPSDIINLKHTDKHLYLTVESHPIILKQIFYYSIEMKNKKFKEEFHKSSNDEDFIGMNFSNSLVEIDKLLKKYNPTYEERNHLLEVNRRELGRTILKAIEFINNDVNSYLNLSLNTSNLNSKTNNTNGMFNSFGGMMNKFVNNIFTNNTKMNSEYTYSTYNSRTPSTKINTESKENSAIASIDKEFLSFNKKEHNFNYTCPLELKNLIYNCFFKLGELNNINHLKSYVDEISNICSKLLYFSIDTLTELFEVRAVKNSLYEYTYALKEEKRVLIKEFNELTRQVNSLKYINEHIEKERDNLRRNLVDFNEEVKFLKKNNEEKEIENSIFKLKISKLEEEFLDYRSISKKHIFNLESDLKTVLEERDNLFSILNDIKEKVLISNMK